MRSVAVIVAVLLASTLDAGSSQRSLAISLRARAFQPGEAVLVTIAPAAAVPQVVVRAFDRDWPAYQDTPRTWRALVGIDLDAKPGSYLLEAWARGSGTDDRASQTLRVVAKSFRTRTLTVDPDFVSPPPDMEARIVREAAEIEQMWNAGAAERLWTKPFTRPVPGQPNSAFGSRSVYNGVPRSPHGGADFPGRTGTPIHAPNAGRVVMARELYFTGNTVVIDHGLGLFSLLAHLSRIDVREGDLLSEADLVGAVGATGRVTGPHLHWAVRLNGSRVDPMSLLAMVGKP